MIDISTIMAVSFNEENEICDTANCLNILLFFFSLFFSSWVCFILLPSVYSKRYGSSAGFLRMQTVAVDKLCLYLFFFSYSFLFCSQLYSRNECIKCESIS